MPGNLMTEGKPYLSIVGGNIVQKVSADTAGARKREYELPNKQNGVKWELVYTSWTGKIFGITFKDTDYGEVCHIELDDAVLSLNTASRYFQDLACKLFSGDLQKDFTFHPYDMETESGRKTGISLQQGGEKLKNYFYDGEKNLHGFPEVDKARATKKTYWKTYFIEVADFLIEKLKSLEFDTPKEEALVSADGTPIADDLPF